MGAGCNIYLMAKVYLIDNRYIERYGFINTNIDPKKLNPIIFRAQKTRLEPVLGTTLYDKIIDDFDGYDPDDPSTGPQGLYKTLLDDYILDFLVAWVDWAYTFHGTYQMTNKTVGRNRDEHIESNSTENNNDVRDQILKDAKQFERKMIGWLQDNKDDIPEYCDTPIDKEHQTINPSKRGSSYHDSISII